MPEITFNSATLSQSDGTSPMPSAPMAQGSHTDQGDFLPQEPLRAFDLIKLTQNLPERIAAVRRAFRK
jgi:hypothetical protein